MALEPITRLIVRRGTELQRSGIDLTTRAPFEPVEGGTGATLLVGEPAYCTDSKRLYIGDGETVGGNAVGMRNCGFVAFTASSSNVPDSKAPQLGDIVFDTTSQLLYTLTDVNFKVTSSWTPIGANLTADNITVQIVNDIISVKTGALNFSYVEDAAIGRGLERTPAGTGIQIVTPSPELSFTGDVLGITDFSIGNTKLENMPANSVKARQGSAGTPTDIPFDALASVLAPLILQYAPAVAIVPTGTILDFAGDTPPSGYLFCDGSPVSKTTYADLYNIIGDIWGTPPSSDVFVLPDMRGRTAIGSGAGIGLTSRVLAQSTGQEAVLLTANQSGLRSHVHVVPRDNRTPGSIDSTGAGSESGGSNSSSFNYNTLANAAEDAVTAHTNMQPSVVTNKIIKT